MKPDINRKICAYIRTHYAGKYLSVEAQKIGVPQSNLYRIVKQGENPDISVSTAWKYALYFKKTFPEFLLEVEKEADLEKK